MNTASKVALDKQKHPERYCAEPRCLWKIMKYDHILLRYISSPADYPGGRCPRHQLFRAVVQEMTREEFAARYPKGKP